MNSSTIINARSLIAEGPTTQTTETKGATFLRVFSKIVCGSVLFLIFFGALVTSNDAGLSVPDWPTTYGENMFLYSPSKWTGLIFYEHVHRLIASGVGFLTLTLAISLAFLEKRKWLRILGFVALFAVIVQGVLGGLTVIYKLPDAISVSHGVLAQTFFSLIIIITYSLSRESDERRKLVEQSGQRELFRSGILLFIVVYLQLIVGAIMRHSESGIAVPDFPQMGATFLPDFSAAFLGRVNEMRLALGMGPVTLGQTVVHLLHRGWALVVVAVVLVVALKAMAFTGLRKTKHDIRISWTAKAILTLVLVQFFLGVLALISVREPTLTSVHVMSGAALLGLSVLYAIRSFPIYPKSRVN